MRGLIEHNGRQANCRCGCFFGDVATFLNFSRSRFIVSSFMPKNSRIALIKTLQSLTSIERLGRLFEVQKKQPERTDDRTAAIVEEPVGIFSELDIFANRLWQIDMFGTNAFYRNKRALGIGF